METVFFSIYLFVLKLCYYIILTQIHYTCFMYRLYTIYVLFLWFIIGILNW